MFKIVCFTIFLHSFVNGLTIHKNDREKVLNVFEIKNILPKEDNNNFSGSIIPRGYNDELCSKQLSKLYDDLISGQKWTLNFIDSWGKIPAGILWGNLVHLGNFEECLNSTHKFKEREYGVIQGQYCLANIPFNAEDMLNSTKSRAIPTPKAVQGFAIGTCLPDVCNPEEINEKFTEIVENIFNTTINSSIISENFCYKNEPLEFTAVDFVAIVLFSTIGLIMLISSGYDLLSEYLKNEPKPLLVVFSIPRNMSKLLKVQNNSSSDLIECLNGIRCLSIIWVVYGHSFIVSAVMPNINLIFLGEWFKNYYSMFLLSATVSVDTFFFLSGFLVGWGLLKQLDKSGSINIPLMYFHRYLRLTPVLAAAVLFSVSLIRYIPHGPYAKTFLSMTVPACEEYWWSTLLYVQNYVNPSKICLGHSWYLSVDTQLYILSPLILIPLYKWKRKFIGVIVILILLSMACTFTTFMLNDFTIISVMGGGTGQMEKTYYPTHTRYSPWLIGVLIAYYLFCRRDRRIVVSKFIVILGWISCLSVIGAIIFGPYDAIQRGSETLESAFYESCSRVSWSIALSWIVFACTQGYGGIVNSFLSAPIWQPFGRLTYCVYIIHMILQLVMSANVKTNTHFSDFEAIYKFWSDLGVTLTISIIAVLAFESPIIGLEKLMFKSKNNISQPNEAGSREQLCNNGESSNKKNDNIL